MSLRRNKPLEKQLPFKVSVRAMDLRDTQNPIICGHYRDDTIAGAEKQIDRRLVDGRLSARHRLGIYASDIGTSTIELIPPNKEAQKRGTNKGALVVGLGDWGSITAQKITETVRDGVVSYLLEQKATTQNSDMSSSSTPTGLKLNSLLIGYNSTTHISVESAVDAVVRGVCRANRHYLSVMKQSVTQGQFHINELEFVEYYLDTAITAAHAVASLSSRISKDFERLQVCVEADKELKFTGDIRNRLQVNASVGYWPRLMITDADQEQRKCAAECYDITDLSSLSGMPDAVYQLLLKGLCNESKEIHGMDENADAEARGESKTVNSPQQYALAKRLKYVFLSEKARAEAQVQQRQPGLIEGLIAQFITQSKFDIGLSRILFQLMIPLDLKAVVRESEQMLLILDGYTANLPWEMIYVDDKPLAVKAAIVRQFVSSEYRQQVNTSTRKNACVIGNPSTANFFNHFTIEGVAQHSGGLAPLLGATKEAQSVTKQLKKSGYTVEEVFPAGESIDEIGCDAKDVFNALSKNAYRILMIAAHGLVNVQHHNGTRQTGVVLSDGIMLTAAEIRHLEVVPELVFLNCCNLAITDNEATSYNKLAYSLSRELIEMGVRCVVAAGWEVDDDAARLFSESFFSAFVYKGKPFGAAVWEARKKTYDNNDKLNTWGAYQAYGDPAYVLDPGNPKSKTEEKFCFVAPQELLEQLTQLRVKNKHGEGFSLEKANKKINRLFEAVPDQSWKERPEILMEIATLYGELGSQGFASAIAIYERIIVEEDKLRSVPIKAIEQLANLEARMGGELEDSEKALALIEKSIQRIEHLSLSTLSSTGEGVTQNGVERSAILGSANKLKAAVLSRFDKPDWELISDSLFNCCIAYSTGGDNTYTLLNRIQFEALLLGRQRDSYKINKTRLKQNVDLAKQCQTTTRERFKEGYDFFDAVMAADAELAIMLSQQGLDNEADRDALLKTYQDSIKGVSASAREMASVTRNLYLLAGFFKARAGDENSVSTEADLTVAGHLEYVGRELTASV